MRPLSGRALAGLQEISGDVCLAQEDSVRAALLLEQAALFQLYTAPPLLRKFAFHTVLAGLRYNGCKQQNLGMRAYKCGTAAPWRHVASE